MIEQFYLTHNITPAGTTTPGQRGPGSNGNGVLYIPQNLGLELHPQMQFSVLPKKLVAVDGSYNAPADSVSVLTNW